MASNVITSIAQAISFLTRPLSFIHDAATVNSLQSILRSTLCAAAHSAPNRKLVLTFTVATPPRPIVAACIALEIQWAEWIEVLGNRDFDLFVDPRSLAVCYSGIEGCTPPYTLVLWTAPQYTQATRSLLAHLSIPQVPISRLGQKSALKRRCTITPPRIFVPASPPLYGRSLAQQLDSDHEEEMDELLAMISTSAIISPTPTRERFCASNSQTQIKLPYASFSPVSSPEPCSSDRSRPSSRSSTFSAFSFSDNDSLSSATSFSPSTQSECSSNKSLPLPRHPQPSKPHVFINRSMNNTTRYLYQGGVSNTLGGGVMLGRPLSSAPNAPVAQTTPSYPAPKYRAPISNKKTASTASSWRRPMAATAPRRA